ncbi:heme utilization cystosolic carrier protein HutX [Vibrio sp. RC27]
MEKLVEEQPALSVAEIAIKLGMSEGGVTLALPQEYVTRIHSEYCQLILETLADWGPVTTIIHSAGSIFEVKAPFPKGKLGHGYYNLVGGNNGELHGHLKIDLVSYIAFVSKPFRGVESHFIGFYDIHGQCVFKVYLGRDKKRQLIPEQVELFQTLKQELSDGK